MEGGLLMALHTKQAQFAICDGCGSERILGLNENPGGFSGKAKNWRTNHASNWYACSPECVQIAITNVTSTSPDLERLLTEEEEIERRVREEHRT